MDIGTHEENDFSREEVFSSGSCRRVQYYKNLLHMRMQNGAYKTKIYRTHETRRAPLEYEVQGADALSIQRLFIGSLEVTRLQRCYQYRKSLAVSSSIFV
jgi:hypothetical protein